MKKILTLLLVFPVLPVSVMAAEVQEQAGTGSEILSTVIAVAVGILLAWKIITKKKL